MSDVLREVLRQAATAGEPPLSVELLFADLRTRRRRRAGLRAAAAVVTSVVAVVAVVTIADRGTSETVVPPAVSVPQGWSHLPPSPLSARTSVTAVTIGDEALFLGGSTSSLCPPGADCREPMGANRLTDGAAYNVRTGTWRLLASAPTPLTGGRAAVTGNIVHLLVGANTHLAYDVLTDRWETLPAPHREGLHEPPYGLMAAGRYLIAYYAEGAQADQIYDPTTKTWIELPIDPLAPSFNRSLVWTGEQVVVVAAALVPNPGSLSPTYAQAAVLELPSRTWRRLPDAKDIVADFGWSWDGRSVVNPSTTTVNGGTVNGYGRDIHVGGRLEPHTGTWSLLPTPPADQPHFSTYASSPRYKLTGGPLFDTERNVWSFVPPAPTGVGDAAGQTWVGDELLVVWGGGSPLAHGGDGTPLSSGGLYRP